MDNRAVEMVNQVLPRADGTYLSKTIQLPESGLDHMVRLHHQAAIPYLQAGQLFYVLNRTETPPMERFIAMLDRATAVPLLKTWGAELWKQGMKNKLIEKGIRRGVLNSEAE